MHDLFVFKQTGLDDKRRAQGYFHTTGLRPHYLDRLSAAGLNLPVEMFERRVLGPQGVLEKGRGTAAAADLLLRRLGVVAGAFVWTEIAKRDRIRPVMRPARSW